MDIVVCLFAIRIALALPPSAVRQAEELVPKAACSRTISERIDKLKRELDDEIRNQAATLERFERAKRLMEDNKKELRRMEEDLRDLDTRAKRLEEMLREIMPRKPIR